MLKSGAGIYIKTFTNHGQQLLDELNRQRRLSVFCDIVVHVSGDVDYTAHRCVLAASSAKLHALTSEIRSTEPFSLLPLNMVNANGFQPLLDFIYTGTLHLTKDNAADVLSTAIYLELSDVVETCQSFIKEHLTGDDYDSGRCPGAQQFAAEADFRYSWSAHEPCRKILDGGFSLGSMAGLEPSVEVLEKCMSLIEDSEDQMSSRTTGENMTKDLLTHSQDCCREICDVNCHQLTHDNSEPVVWSPVSMEGQRSEEGTVDNDEDDDDENSDVDCTTFVDEPMGPLVCGVKASDRLRNHLLDSYECSSSVQKHGLHSDFVSAVFSQPSVDGNGESDETFSVSCSIELNEHANDLVKRVECADVECNASSDKSCSRQLKKRQPCDTSLPVCGTCDRTFSSVNVLTRHMRLHSTQKYSCAVCDVSFTDPAAFKRHSVIVHGERNAFQCSHADCKFRSDRLSNVEKHELIHSRNHDFSCSRCGKTFAQVNGLRSHLLSCCQARSFLCDLCGTTFNHLQSMQLHRRVHTGEKPFTCSDCGSQFADQRNFKRHRRIHENTFPYSCPICNKQFRHSNSLKSHLAMHTVTEMPSMVS